MGAKPAAEFKLDWRPSELPGEEIADLRGNKGRFAIRETNQGNLTLRFNGKLIGYFSSVEGAKSEAGRRAVGIIQGGY
jgi:hypothetical protein